MTITSTLIGLEDIVADEYFFHVPIYQRLYVWGMEQVRTLLADLLAAYKAKRTIYYLGGALVVERDSLSGDGCQFDLIDGQQRFTTLWMLSLVCRESLTAFAYRQNEGDETPKPRIRFPIRPEVDAFFARWIDAGTHESSCDARIIDALAHIETFFEETAKSVNRARFAEFVFRRVKLILTVVPPETDLNKLFELINNRGVQLQHHEILKARVLQAITDPVTRAVYARLWDACAFMNDYVERNLRRQTGIRGTGLFDNTEADTDEEGLASAEEVLEELYAVTSEQTQQRSVTLEGILVRTPRPLPIEEKDAEGENANLEEGDEVRSIISFPMLLQHTLRIWLHERGKPDLERILDKELLGLFGAHFLGIRLKEEDAKSFVRLLWEIRYLFDKHVIKWVRITEQEQHQIHRLARRTEGRRAYLVREQPARNEGFALLQSMLYHSQEITTHYWLTPFLAWIHANPASVDEHFDYLRHLDNRLLCSVENDSLVIRSRRFMEKPSRRPRLDCSELDEPLGLGFRHYWFYKLEFVLWDRRPKNSDSRWAAFRITAKNSIEHVSPQNPQDTDKNRVSERMLDRFGNLALVSRSINSMYGNLPFNEKRQRFHNRNATQIDSLKAARIYDCDRWGDDEAQRHESEMIKLLKDYFKASPIPASPQGR